MSAYMVLAAFLFQRGSAESADPDAPPCDADLFTQAQPSNSPPMLCRGAIARWVYTHSLGIALLMLFVTSFRLHGIFSVQEAAAEAASHNQPALSLGEYLFSTRLWFESFQNWQSEFLSTAVLVVLSIFLRQRGSPESKPVAARHSQTGA